ncbi:MAG: hypothetical protein HYZ37_04385 [Candidatus Solibacter usitatus]|nr:hypothetical protein [Candidatus Solibacter usitatus]
MSCILCEVRKPRRLCPGARGEICAPCCGTEREVTINCPLDCEYLLAARMRERHSAVPAGGHEVPNSDVKITKEFPGENYQLVYFLGDTLLTVATRIDGANDRDVRDALESAIKTYRTRSSGLIHETRPDNPIASAIESQVLDAIARFEEKVAGLSSTVRVRDSEVLPIRDFGA